MKRLPKPFAASVPAELRAELDRRDVGDDPDVVPVDDRLLAREDPAHRDAVPGVADHRGERRALAGHDRQQPAELALHDERPVLALRLVRLEVADEALARPQAGDDQLAPVGVRAGS